MADKQGIPLTSIDGFDAGAAERLVTLWITTAEELVSAAKQEGGLAGLTELLEMPEGDVTALVDMAVNALPPEVSFAPGDPTGFALGALDEDEGAHPDDEPVSFDEPLPPSIDMRHRMPPVRDQGGRGTCVAQACVAVREYLLGEDSSSGDLSEQFLYWACKQRDRIPELSGTWIRVGMAALKGDGVGTEATWRYNPVDDPTNEGQGPPPAGAVAEALEYRVSDTEKLEPRWPTSLKKVLATPKPVAFAVPVYNYWFAEPVRSSGDIRLPLSSDSVAGGHAMCMVGYEHDANVPGGGYFIIRNSWGTDSWGKDNVVQAGHGRLPYAYMTGYGKSAYTASTEPQPDDDGNGSFLDCLRKIWKRIFG